MIVHINDFLRLVFRSFLYAYPLYRVRKKLICRDGLILLGFSFTVWMISRTGIPAASLNPLSKLTAAFAMGMINLCDWAMVKLLCQRKKLLSLLSVLLTDIMIQTAFVAAEAAGSLLSTFIKDAALFPEYGSFNYGFHIPFAESIFSLIFIFTLRFVLKRYEPKENDLKLLVALTLLVMHYNHVIISHYVFEGTELLDNMIVMSGFLVVPALIFLLFFKTVQNAQLKSLEESARKTMELGRSQLALWKQNEEMVIAAKHRIAEHLNILSSFLENGQYESAVLYLKKTGGLTNEAFPLYSKNPYINAVINYKKMNNPEITFDVISSVSAECEGISQVDLGILIMNLIDQRIHEIQKHRLKEKIILRITEKDRILSVRIDSEVSGNYMEDPDISEEIGESVISKIIERHKGKMYRRLKSESDQAVLFTLPQKS